MANDYYDNQTAAQRFQPGETARAGDVDAKFDQVESGFDKFPTEESLNRGTWNFAADTGAADAYAVSLEQTPTSYVDGMEVAFRAANANTGASTIDVDGLGQKNIKRPDGTDLRADDITANKVVSLRYNATAGEFELTNSIPNIIKDAEAWATQTGSKVDNTEYSAKEYAIGTTVAVGSAKDWATQTGGKIDGSEYGAKEWAVGTTVSAGSAKKWAEDAKADAKKSLAKGQFVSTTSLTIGTGSKTLFIPADSALFVGDVVDIRYREDGSQFMRGEVTAYTPSTGEVTVNVTATGGSGTYASWTVGPIFDVTGLVTTSAQTMHFGTSYRIESGSPITVSLPSSVSDNNAVRVYIPRDAPAHTIARNGNTIEGESADLTVDVGGAVLTFRFSSGDWSVAAEELY